VEPLWRAKFAAPLVHVVFGARHTGKSTLLRRLLPWRSCGITRRALGRAT
jgi:hypothetical protein